MRVRDLVLHAAARIGRMFFGPRERAAYDPRTYYRYSWFWEMWMPTGVVHMGPEAEARYNEYMRTYRRKARGQKSPSPDPG